jgi:hypothetical protein
VGLQEDAKHSEANLGSERSRLEAKLTAIRDWMDHAYGDKLDGKIPVDFWERKMADWRMQEQQTQLTIQSLNETKLSEKAMDAARILELANSAYFLYVSQNSTEKAKLLRMLFWNCSVDAVSATPVYRKPFDLIFKRVQKEEWSGRLDSN